MKGFNKNRKVGILIALIIFIVIIVIILLNSNIKLNKKLLQESELQGEITFVSNRTDKRDEIELLIEEFELENPKVKVNLQLIGDAETILQRKASVGELADVTLVPSTISKNEYSNYFLPIDDLGFTYDNIYNYDMGCGDYDKLYCLNSSINWHGILYNKEIFKEANIKELPNTIEELFEICEILKNKNITPIGVNYRQNWTMNLWIDIIPHLFDNDFTKETVLGISEVMDENGGLYKALNLIKDIVVRGYCEEDLLNYDWQQFKNDMSNGKVAMTVWNSDFKFQLVEMGMDEDSIGMFPIPETEIVKIYGDYKFAVSKRSNNPEVAKAFLKYIFEEDRYANAVNIMSSLKQDIDEFIAFDDLKETNIPIEVYSDYIRNKSVEDARLEEIYLQLKNKNGFDFTFVQRYIVEDDIEALVNEVEKKWRESLN